MPSPHPLPVATLNIPFVFSSNGDGFVFRDRTGLSADNEASLTLDEFPSPKQLLSKYCTWKGITSEGEEIVLQDYFDDGSGKAPRYYQMNAINAAMEAIAKGQITPRLGIQSECEVLNLATQWRHDNFQES